MDPQKQSHPSPSSGLNSTIAPPQQYSYFQTPPSLLNPSTDNNQSLLLNGSSVPSSTFRMPSLQALRPPTSANFSPKLMPSVLQPPPSLIRPLNSIPSSTTTDKTPLNYTNPLLNNPLLHKELPKFQPSAILGAPSNSSKPNLLFNNPTAPPSVPVQLNNDQNQWKLTHSQSNPEAQKQDLINKEDDSSYLSHSNKSVNSLKSHDPLFNSFNQSFQQTQPPFHNQQSFNSLSQTPSPSITNTNQQQPSPFSVIPPTQTPSPSILNSSFPTHSASTLLHNQLSFNPILSSQTPPLSVINQQQQQIASTLQSSNNQESTPLNNDIVYEPKVESPQHDSTSEDISQEESNTSNNSFLNESNHSTTTTTTTTTTTSDSSNSNSTENPHFDGLHHENTNLIPSNLSQEKEILPPQTPSNDFTQSQQINKQQTFTPEPFYPKLPVNQPPANFTPVTNLLPAQSQPQIPRFGTITGPPQQKSTESQPQFFSPTPIRPANSQFGPQSNIPTPQSFMLNNQPNGPPSNMTAPFASNRQLSTPTSNTPNVLQQQQHGFVPAGGQLSAPPSFLQQNQPPFYRPQTSLQPQGFSAPPNAGPPTNLQQQGFPAPSNAGPLTNNFQQQGFSAPPNAGPPTNLQQQGFPAPPNAGPPTNNFQQGFSAPPNAGPPTNLQQQGFPAPPNAGPPNNFQQQGFSAPPNMGPPTNNFQQQIFSAPPNAGPPLSSNATQNKPNPLQYKYPTATPTNTAMQPTNNNSEIKPPFQQSTSMPPVQNQVNQVASQLSNMGINKSGQRPLAIDLLQEKRLMPPYDDNVELVRPKFPHEFYTNVNCHPDIIRSTLTAMPESANILSKCRLPLGILIHPFKDLESLKVVQSSTIVRCRNCRSYINPFVHFLDNTKWRCNLCYSVNDLPDEFLFDPVTRSYGDPSKRPEINSSTIEFIAPAEYTLRPPPPAMYLFLLDVSHNAINTGYLQNACDILLESLDKLPGDTRTQIGFITFNSCIHFYNLSDSLSQPQMMVYPDIDDVVLPLPENLMINLTENKETIQTFLQELPSLFTNTNDTENALGTALTAAFKLLTGTGGRVTVMQTCLPTCGVGSLKLRSESIDKDSQSLGPQSDFYKKLALECAGVHIAVDLFMFNALYADLATLSCISKYSGGEIKYYPEFHLERYPEQSDRFCFDLKRYLTRKIGFEAVMRIRCTRGLSIHTFHGNFFVRSTDLLALPNVNPDAGFGMQISIDESLTDVSTVCFQAALLYTSSKSERRIRIHTYCLPVSSNVNDLINGADQEAIIGLVAKMAVDRSIMNSVKEAKDALSNVAIDYLNAYTSVVTKQQKSSLLSPYSLRLIPLYVLALMKSIGFKYGNVKVDDRVYMLNVFKTLPLKYLLLFLYPNLYAVHNIDNTKTIMDSETEICLPPRLHLSSESIDRHGVYILDACESIYMWIGRSVNDQFLQQVFNVKSFNELPDHASELPELDNALSERIRNFIVYLYDQRPFGASFIFFREDSSKSHLFFQHIIEDKTESSLSYLEFIRYLNDQVSKS